MNKSINVLFIELCPFSGSCNGLLAELDYFKQTSSRYKGIIIGEKNSIFEKMCKDKNYTFYGIKKEIHDPELENKPIILKAVIWLYYYLYVLLFCLKISIKHNIKLIHCNHYQFSHFATVLGFILRKHVLIHLKDVFMLPIKLRRVLMKFNPDVTYIAVSKYVKELFVNKFKINVHKTVVIYDGLNNKIFKKNSLSVIRTKINKKTKNIIMMSRVVPDRDIEVFIDIAAILTKKYPNLKFIHYGYVKNEVDKDYLNELKIRIKTLGLNNIKFQLRHFIANQIQVARIIRNSFLILVPARRYALPNIAIESLMSCVPVIARDIGGNREIINNRENGFVTKTDSCLEWALLIEKYLNNKKLYYQHSLNAPSSAISKFGAAMIYQKMEKLYDEVLKTR